ncbi:hypothetical protein [Azospirillum thermophilum]|uniref:hypothetical protein n=1 Tax=Azospirillum thermophilum TaxID=2202148 RepID=UPI00143CE2A3|nr:hypothetical protein [Azospirillum thermophilum]
MEQWEKAVEEPYPDDRIEGQLNWWTRVACGLLLVGMWLCAASIYLMVRQA